MRKVNWKEIQREIGETDLALYCNTKHDAEHLLSKLSGLGYTWKSGLSLLEEDFWDCTYDAIHYVVRAGSADILYGGGELPPGCLFDVESYHYTSGEARVYKTWEIMGLMDNDYPNSEDRRFIKVGHEGDRSPIDNGTIISISMGRLGNKGLFTQGVRLTGITGLEEWEEYEDFLSLDEVLQMFKESNFKSKQFLFKYEDLQLRDTFAEIVEWLALRFEGCKFKEVLKDGQWQELQ